MQGKYQLDASIIVVLHFFLALINFRLVPLEVIVCTIQPHLSFARLAVIARQELVSQPSTCARMVLTATASVFVILVNALNAHLVTIAALLASPLQLKSADRVTSVVEVALWPHLMRVVLPVTRSVMWERLVLRL